MEVLFPHTINKTALKALEDNHKCWQNPCPNLGMGGEKRKKEREGGKKHNIVKPEGEKHFPCE